MSAGPKGAAPPVITLTEAKWELFTMGWVAKKLTRGGTMARTVGCNTKVPGFLLSFEFNFLTMRYGRKIECICYAAIISLSLRSKADLVLN